jgi:nitrite reductase/ring-hydroxylating ferredoxin subunit
MRVDNQAQFHPLKFVTQLLDALQCDRLSVFENTRALTIDDASTCVVKCEHGEVRAKHVVIATQFPFYDRGAFFSRLYAYQDYAVGVQLKGVTAEGMLHDLEHYGIRTYPAPGDPLLIVSGGSHKTGQGGDERKKYAQLLDWVRGHYGVEAVDYHWSTEDYYTPDGIPYVGRSPGSSRIFLATGFAAWGMTNSAAAALLMSDMVLGRENERWAEVFDPSRARPKASWREFLKENVNVAATAVSGKLAGGGDRRAEDLLPGEGALVREGGRTRAAYREADGRLILLEPSCRHMGCDVTFNEAERTWDCPCHGSRYSAEGRVIHGPALRPLKRVEPASAETKAHERTRPAR